MNIEPKPPSTRATETMAALGNILAGTSSGFGGCGGRTRPTTLNQRKVKIDHDCNSQYFGIFMCISSVYVKLHC